MTADRRRKVFKVVINKKKEKKNCSWSLQWKIHGNTSRIPYVYEEEDHL